MRKPRPTEVSFYRAFVISKAGRKWLWQHENCDGDDRRGFARTRDEAVQAVDDWYERPRNVQIIHGMAPREVIAIAAIVAIGLTACWLALAFRTGGF